MPADWDRELEDLNTPSDRRRRWVVRWLPIPLALLIVGALTYVAYEVGRHHAPKKRPPAAQVLRNPDRASCSQIGFGSRRFPRASSNYTLQTARTLANGYLDTGS